MRLLTYTLMVIGLLICLSSHSIERSVILPKGPFKVDLIGSADWLTADHRSLSLGQLQVLGSPQFHRLKKNPILKSNHIYWLRFKVINPFDFSIPTALTLGQSTFQVQAAYSFTNDNWQRLSGYEQAFRLNANRAIQILLPPQSKQWLYFRVKSDQTFDMSPTLSDLAEYTKTIITQEQLLGAMISLMIFIVILHIVAARFHQHIRHYIVMFMAAIGMLHGSILLPLSVWPDWMYDAIKLIPWGLAIGILLSSFTNLEYRTWLRSSLSGISVLVLLLISLLMFNLSNEIVWIAASFPAALAIYKNIGKSLYLLSAALITVAYSSWLFAYALWPEHIPYLVKSIDLITPALIVFLSSLSMLLTYFRRQKVLHRPSQVPLAQTEFLSKLSHELRTPINGVLGMSELLTDTSLTETQRDFADTIQVSGNEILLLANRISDYSKIATGKCSIEKNTIELSSIIHDSLSKFQQIAHQKHVELVVNLSDQLPKTIQSDREKITAILTNLIDNALSQTQYGEIEIKIQCRDINGESNLTFEIKDTGDGLPREELLTIFESFNLVEPAKSRRFNSNALGLAVSKKLVELMGGQIYADSTMGLGSCFSFLLPYKTAHTPETCNDNNNDLAGLSILIVDDNSTLRKVIQRYASNWGMQADTTYSGKEALAMLRTKANLNTPYDVVLIDQDMPMMNGFQLAERIKDDSQLSNNLIKIMLTGLAISSTSEQAVKAGIHQVVTKPVSSQALQQVLSKLINNEPQHKSPSTFLLND